MFVFAAHVVIGGAAAVHQRTGLPAALDVAFTHGWLGVDLFFILSGFLITRILLRSRDTDVRRYYGTFYERRALRILPLYLVVLAVLAVAYHELVRPEYVAVCLTFLVNLAPLAHVDVPGQIGPIWSLCVEEQFYLVWPIVVLFLDRRRLTFVVVAIVLVEPILRIVLVDQSIQYTWLRCDGLAWGAFLALRTTSPGRNIRNDDGLALALCGAALLLAALSARGARSSEFVRGLTLEEALLIFSAVMLYAIAHAGSRPTAVLRGGLLERIAARSYCLYLVHVPLVDAYNALERAVAPYLATHEPVVRTVARTVAVTLVSYAIAEVSRRYLELPFLELGRSRPLRPERSSPPAG